MSQDRRIRKNLKKHQERMEELIAQGMPKDEASKQAFYEIIQSSSRYGYPLMF